MERSASQMSDFSSRARRGKLGRMRALIRYFNGENAGKAVGRRHRAAQPVAAPCTTLPARVVGLIPAGGNHPANPARRILVVDDEPQVAAAIRMVLVHAGHQVEVAGDAESALSMFEAGKHDLVTTDFSLPKSDGFRSGPRTPGAVSVSAHHYDNCLCRSNGARTGAIAGHRFSHGQALFPGSNEESSRPCLSACPVHLRLTEGITKMQGTCFGSFCIWTWTRFTRPWNSGTTRL